MAALPRITVVTPSFRHAAYLETTLRSVLDQGYPNLEYFVVDGGSDDGTVDILRKYDGQLAWWCSEKDRGQTHAINKGLARATGEIIVWVNSDDLLLPGSLQQIARAFARPGVDAACSWVTVVDPQGKRVGLRTYPQPTAAVLRCRSLLACPGVFWRKSLMDRIGLLDESLQVCMDLDYWMRMVEHGVVPKLIPRFLASFRVHPEQKTQNLLPAWEREWRGVFERVHGPGVTEKSLKRQVPRLWRYALLKRATRLGLVRPPKGA
ncbi:MAG: glycosyltransferase family 2 protein [Planctomycetota bacterium]|nr:glycosyltransferase family 2 protein [Planctomycetota bacterium]